MPLVSKLISPVLSLAAAGLIWSALVQPSHSAPDCEADKSEQACTERKIAKCIKNDKGFHIDWVIDCIRNAKKLPAKMEDLCTSYHTVKTAYKNKCGTSTADPETKVTCTWLVEHKKGCGG